MQYNEKYDRWVTKEGLVYRYSKGQEKLVLCKLYTDTLGYLSVGVLKPKTTKVRVHRIVYETFIGEIPQGFDIDHINTVRHDNILENLRAVTHKENQNNPLTIKHMREARKGNKYRLGKPSSEFGRKFREHYGKTRCEDVKLYSRELMWYRNHNRVCRWE